MSLGSHAPRTPDRIFPAGQHPALLPGYLAHMRARFLRAVALMPVDHLIQALEQAAAMGWGTICAPTDAGTNARPASHLHEINLFGQHATGATAEEAARNWRICAMRLWADGGAEGDAA